MRQDPFSTYRSGFEIRTYRLCKRILTFHRFPEEFDAGAPDPLLVRSTDFTYEPSAVMTYLTRVTQKGYSWNDGTSSYDSASLPAVDLDYTRATFDTTVRQLDERSATGLPVGLGTRDYQWVDLDGEGAPGVLTQQGGALRYKRNLGQGKLAPGWEQLPQQPSGVRIGAQARAGQQLLDITGDGLPDLVDLGGPAKGFHSRTDDGSWTPMRRFDTVPNVDWADPSLRFIDLTGDGFADVLVSEDQVYTWYPSLRDRGFGPPRRASRWTDETKGPTVVFREAEQTVFLGDMTGDGLVDLVRVRNGNICYWPNLGYGRFGPKVAMADAPHMAQPNLYHPARVRLADLDGSGTADLIYVGADGVSVWLNQAGNSFAPKQRLGIFPDHSVLSTVDFVDMLGTGTSCLVWSTPLQGRPPNVRYVDLLSSTKPHLLSTITNNLGLETFIQYTTSTQQYLGDRAKGITWATRIPFPVQVVARVEHYDHVSKLRFVSTYGYRHGFYDAEEREFRGFGYVEQRDAESVDENLGHGRFPSYPVENGEMQQPPTVTKSWFHTGAWWKKSALLQAFEAEWFSGNPSEPRLTMPAMRATPRMSPVEYHQAYRALSGKLLRQEIYAETGDAAEANPYVVTQHIWTVERLQPTGEAPFAVFRPLGAETLTIQYERITSNPRISHELVVATDELGYVTRSASVAYAYGTGADYSEQNHTWATATESSFKHPVGETGWYRHGLPVSSKQWELGSALVSGLSPGELVSVSDVATALGWDEVAYDGAFGEGDKRLLSYRKHFYWKNDLTGALPFDQVESLALPHRSYVKALTNKMLTDGSLLNGNVTATDGGFVDLDDDDDYWAQSGLREYDSGNFYLVSRINDAFGNETAVSYDDYSLFVTETVATLTSPSATLVTTADIDYRVAAPYKVTDPNGNWVDAAFDELGRVTTTAVQGKGQDEGDSLADPTTRTTYELDRYQSSQLPARVKTELREEHGGSASWLVSYGYSDGSGHEVMRKVKAEPGDAVQLDENGDPETVSADPRWVGTGRTVFDNKGNPIKQYEPYFSATEEYEDDPVLVH